LRGINGEHYVGAVRGFSYTARNIIQILRILKWKVRGYIWRKRRRRLIKMRKRFERYAKMLQGS